MSQVLPVTNETPKTPEPSNIQRNDDNFFQIFEQEKLKRLFPSMLPVNFQSFFNTPLVSGFESDISANKIENSGSFTNYSRQYSYGTAKADDTPSVKEIKHDQPVKAGEEQKEAKAEQINLTANALNRTFAGELELSPDFYNTVIAAKNKIDSLRSIDVEDMIAQIKDKIKFLIENGKSELSIELKPDNLGTILMSISSNKGILSINIYADQAAKQVLEENIAELERSLKQANINIEKLNISANEGRKYKKGETG